MNIQVIVQSLSEGVDPEIISSLEDDHSQLSKLLNVSENYDEHNDFENFISDLDDYPPTPILSPGIMRKYKLTFPESDDNVIQDSYSRVILRRNESTLGFPLDSLEGEESTVFMRSMKQLFMVRKLLGEQLGYLGIHCPINIRVYFIYSVIDSHYNGGMFAFWNSDRPDDMFIQGISKSLIYTLHSLFAPKTTPFPSLNSLLQPSIEKLARELGAKRIIVAPIGKQGEILTRYYGYTQTRDIYFPSLEILGRENILHDPDLYPVYEKYL
jgi:hypothetical protein